MIAPLTVDEVREQIDLRLQEIDDLWAVVTGGRPELLRPLTDRERLVARRAAWSDMSTAQIARELYVSPETVRSQLKSVYRKLGLGGHGSRLRLRRALIEAERIPAT